MTASLKHCATELACIALTVPPQRMPALCASLSAAERSRAARLRFARHRRRFIVARAHLRELLGERLQARPESIEFSYGPNGKPALAGRFAASGWRFNLSHCEELALYAFSRSGEVGVDVEAVRELSDADAIAARFFSPAEGAAYASLAAHERPRGFFTCWTRKEALAKGLGSGLASGLETPDASSPPPGWRLQSFSPAPGFIAALAWR